MAAPGKRTPARTRARPAKKGTPPGPGTGQPRKEGQEGAQRRESGCGTSGRPRTYETPEELEEAVEAYFFSISRTVDAVELVDSGRRDDHGHVIYEPVKIWNDGGEVIRKTEYILPPSVTDLCLHLGITRQTWVNYGRRAEFRDITDRTKARVKSYLVRESLTRTKGLQGVLFNLQNNFDEDEREQRREVSAFDLSQMTDEELMALAGADPEGVGQG